MVLFFKQLSEILVVLQIGLFVLNAVINGKMFSFDGFLGFRKFFCGIERAF